MSLGLFVSKVEFDTVEWCQIYCCMTVRNALVYSYTLQDMGIQLHKTAFCRPTRAAMV